MKLTFVGLTAIALTAHSVIAACTCKSGDVSCFNKCVLETNECITSCGSNTVCYQKCIDNSWPGGNGDDSKTTTTRSSTTKATTTKATTTKATTTRSTTTERAITTTTSEPLTASSTTADVTESLSSIASEASSVASEASSLIASPSIVTGTSLATIATPSSVGSILPTASSNEFLSRVSSAAESAASEMAALSSSVAAKATSAGVQPGAQPSQDSAQNAEGNPENAGGKMMPALGLSLLSVALAMVGFQ